MIPAFKEEHHSREEESFEYEDPTELNHRQESDYRRWMLVRHIEIRCRGTKSIRCRSSLRISDEVKKNISETKETTVYFR